MISKIFFLLIFIKKFFMKKKKFNIKIKLHKKNYLIIFFCLFIDSF